MPKIPALFISLIPMASPPRSSTHLMMLSRSPAITDREARAASAQTAELAGDLVREPDILGRFVAELTQAGLVGEDRNAKILYLALTTRLFDRPVSVAIKGPSSGGKSYTVEVVLKF